MRFEFPNEYFDIGRLDPVSYESPRFQNEHGKHVSRQERVTGPTIINLDFKALCDIEEIDEIIRRNIGQPCIFTLDKKKHKGVIHRYNYEETKSGYDISLEVTSVYDWEEIEDSLSEILDEDSSGVRVVLADGTVYIRPRGF